MDSSDASRDGSPSVGAFGNFSRKTMIIVGSIVAAVVLMCICGGIGVGTYTGNISDGNAKEAALSGTYSNGANYLSKCMVSSRQAASVATANAAAFDQVIKDAVAGHGQAGQLNLHTPTGQAGLFPLLVQAYPDLKGQTDLFNKVLTVVVSCLDDFRSAQSAVLDLVRDFNSWRTGFWTSRLGGSSFPNENLYIAIPGVERVTGEAALRKMEQPIADAVTSDAYKSGIVTPPDLFPKATPAPSAS